MHPLASGWRINALEKSMTTNFSRGIVLGDMDVLLIFVSVVQLTCFFQLRLNRLFDANLFSAVNTAFIVNMTSS